MRGETGASWTNESISNKVKRGSSLILPDSYRNPASIVNAASNVEHVRVREVLLRLDFCVNRYLNVSVRAF